MNVHGRFRLGLLLLGVLLTSLAHAEVTKLAFPSESGFDFVWWPELTAPPSWEQDYDASVANAINVLVPAGGSFSDAETIIYARALFRETPGTPPTLAEFIENDFKSHKSFDPNVKIVQSDPLVIADGSSLEVFTFFPDGAGNSEKVAYGEDGQFFLLFVLSSRTSAGYEDAIEDFEAAVRSYAREPEESASSE